MTIKLKIMIMLGMFAFALIGFAAYESINSYIDYRQATDIEHMSEIAVASSDLVHELQKERGYTAGYIGSKGDEVKLAEFRQKLKDQRGNTDDKLKDLRELSTKMGHLPDSFEEQKQAGLDQLESLAAKRQLVDNLDIELKDALGYYTSTNARFLDGISIMGKYSDNADISSRVNAYASFLKSKERAGIERAILTNVFANDAFDANKYRHWIQRVTEQESYMHEFENYAISVPEYLKAYEESKADPSFAKVIAFRETAQSKAQSGNFGVNPVLWFDTITEKITKLKQLEDMMGQDLIDTSKAQQWTSLIILFLLIGIAMGVITAIFVFGFLSSRSITKPLADLMGFMQVVTNGDLSINVPKQKRKDEIAQSIQALGHLVETLREILTSVSDASEQVTTKAAEIVTNSDQVAEGVSEQTNQTNQISAAIQQMAMTSQEVTQQSSNATTSAAEAGHQAEEGAGYVKDTVSGMSSIAEMVTSSADSVTELGRKSDEIGQIILMINDIADQTNLLALNAAIEAARAGDHGRGFAVVADEVRKLAERTSNATQKVSAAIENIQEGIHTAVSEMQQGSESVKEGVTLASTAGDSLNVIVAGSREVAGLIQSIAAASREQSAAAQEISHNIESIAMINEQTNQGVQQSAQAAMQLKDSSDALQKRVQQFKLR